MPEEEGGYFHEIIIPEDLKGIEFCMRRDDTNLTEELTGCVRADIAPLVSHNHRPYVEK